MIDLTQGEIKNKLNEEKAKDKIINTNLDIIINKMNNTPLTNKEMHICPACHKGYFLVQKEKNTGSCFYGDEDCNLVIPAYAKEKNVTGFHTYGVIKSAYGLSTFEEVLNKYNELMGIEEETINTNDNDDTDISEYMPEEIKFDHVITVNEKLSEKKDEVVDIINNNKHTCLRANTGAGKSSTVVKIADTILEEVDYIFFLQPTRALCEQTAGIKDDNDRIIFKPFMAGKYASSNHKCYACTYDNIDNIISFIESQRMNVLEKLFNASAEEYKPIKYCVIVDECHELLLKRLNDNNYRYRNVDKIMKSADLLVLTSANTEDIIREMKKDESYNFKYVDVIQTQMPYNLKELNLIRLPRKNTEGELLEQLYAIKKRHDRVLCMIDNKGVLEDLNNELLKQGYNVCIINSKNKNGSARKDYDLIVEKSLINKDLDFLLVTSVINAGINIKNTNVGICIYQSDISFNINKIEQFLGRLRSKEYEESCGYIFLKQGNFNKYSVMKYADLYNWYNEKIGLKCDELNNLYTKRYGKVEKTNKDYANFISNEWNSNKDHEDTASIKYSIYADNGILKVDNLAVAQYVREDFEKQFYYSNSFVMQSLNRIKAETFNKAQIIEPSAEKLDKQDKEDKLSFTEYVNLIKQDNTALKELKEYFAGELRGNKIKNELVLELYDNYKDDKNLRKLKAKTTSLVNLLKNNKDVCRTMIDNYLETIINILATEKVKKNGKDKKLTYKEKEKCILTLNYMAFNLDKNYQIGSTTLEDLKETNATKYVACRMVGDVIVANRHKLNQKNINDIFKLYIKLSNKQISKQKDKDGNVVEKLKDKKNDTKSVTVQAVKWELLQILKSIYNVTEKCYLSGLKTDINAEEVIRVVTAKAK